MKKKSVIGILRFIVKYVFPLLIGWLEGDSHVIESFLTDCF